MWDFKFIGALEKAIASVLVIAIVYLLIRVSFRLIKKVVKSPESKYAIRKSAIYGSTVFSLILVATIWIEVISSFTTFLGIIGAGVALALKDPLTSIAGWFYLTISRTYSLGDRVEIDNLKGDVVDVSIFHTTMLEVDGWVDSEQSTGRLVTFPHNWLFTKRVYNYSKGFRFIWTEVSLVITFESNLKLASDIILKRAQEICGNIPELAEKALKDTSNKYLIRIGKLTPIVYTKVIDSGVKLSARFLTRVRARRQSEHDLYNAILEDFAKEQDVNLAYPTYRLVQNQD
ncbi:mechanosensitive ion channel family protein [bacterium]|nr:mechanosensitive ion channel family protein [bacterium]